MSGFVDNLFGEQIFDRGRKVVHLQPLTPATVDVIKHPLQGPQPSEQTMRLVVVDTSLAHRRDNRLYGSRAAFCPALADQFPRQILTGQLGHNSPTSLLQLAFSSFPRTRE